jgi:hypothetical protein
MADERDQEVSRSYRELGAAEPSRELDERILAASRRSIVRRRRWYGPVAVAAALMLAVAVTVQVERKTPEEAVVASAPPEAQKEAKVETAPAEAPKPSAQEKKRFTPEPPPAPRQNADAPAPEPARREMEAQRPLASAAGARLMSKVESPEAWLERIAGLRKQGKDDEADKALAEFRKRYPDYRLSDEMRAKVERK